jgi:anaerobic dimethyl sulfoxide reductase subunit A
MEKEKQGLSRRSFVKWSAAAAALAGTSGLVACANPSDPGGAGGSNTSAVNPYEDGEWKVARCWAACGGNCVNLVLVKDGVAVYQKTDSTGDDSFDNPQQRSCTRGRSLRKFVFSDQRLKYPIKRKNWQPGGGTASNSQLRGEDEWERISWDEAIELAASEINRIKDNYGVEALFSPTSSQSRIASALGGTLGVYGPTSSGGFIAATTRMVGGGWTWAPLTLSCRFQLRKSKVIILWGHNPVTVSQGNAILNFLAAKEAGAKFIVIDPCYTETAKVLDAEYIPIRPTTDTAMLLALAYEMIKNNWQDQAFLDKYTIGFDADHMPEGANPQDNFKDYVLGTYDGVPKTPEWATEICGTPVEMIRSLAETLGTVKPLAFTCARASARSIFGEQFSQAFLTVAWMTGNVGKDGAMAGHVVTNNVGSGGGGFRIAMTGAQGVDPIPNAKQPFPMNQIDPSDTNNMMINFSEMWTAILTKEFTATSRGKLPIDVKGIITLGANTPINQNPGAQKGIEAHKAVEFVVTAADRMTPNAQYADIVFPLTTPWEDPYNGSSEQGYNSCNRDTLLLQQQICEPLFEAKPYEELEALLAEALGLDPKLVVPLSIEQKAWNSMQNATVFGDDGVTKETLFTITEDDIPDGIEGKPQEGRITIEQAFKDTYYRVPRSPGDKHEYIALKDYVDDPVKNARPTQSGKLEIYCQALAEFVADCGFSEKSPIAKYQVPTVGYETTFSDWENKVKGEYPLQNFSTHTFRTAHSMFDADPYQREAFPNNIQMNTIDADERGIKNGDTVLVSSAYGSILRNAWVTETIMPGVTRLDECAWLEVDPKTGLCKSGNQNMLNGQIPNGVGIQAWNSSNVQIEKWDGEALQPDYLWPERIVEV